MDLDRAVRFWCLVASLACDLDGLPILWAGVEGYQRWHHVVTHNLAFLALLTVVSLVWIGPRPGAAARVAACGLLHLAGDYVGSGPGWGLFPLEPFSDRLVLCDRAWPLDGWQNVVITVGLGVLAIRIACRHGRTPIEFVSRDLDRLVVDAMRLRGSFVSCCRCPSRAGFRCCRCGAPVCSRHVARWSRLVPVCVACDEEAARGV